MGMQWGCNWDAIGIYIYYKQQYYIFTLGNDLALTFLMMLLHLSPRKLKSSALHDEQYVGFHRAT